MKLESLDTFSYLLPQIGQSNQQSLGVIVVHLHDRLPQFWDGPQALNHRVQVARVAEVDESRRHMERLVCLAFRHVLEKFDLLFWRLRKWIRGTHQKNRQAVFQL